MPIVRKCEFPVFDADNHLYETQDAFTRHLPKAYDGLIEYVSLRGRTKIVVKGKISNFIPNPTFEVVARPGAHEEYYKNGNPEGKSLRELTGEPMRCIPAFREPEPRIELMDQLGVDRTLMFPTLASLLEERLRDDPEAIHAVVHSLNQWLHETWSFNYKNRIFTTPVISLPIVEKAIEELEWVRRTRRKGDPDSTRARSRLPWLPLVRLRRVRSFLEASRRVRRPRRDALRR